LGNKNFNLNPKKLNCRLFKNGQVKKNSTEHKGADLFLLLLPEVPQKAVAEVSGIGHYI
jgi:hypothetical protein